MKSYTIDEYLRAGCTEIMVSAIMLNYSSLDGKVCDTGCWKFHNGKCGAYQRLIYNLKKPEVPYETVRDEAKRRDISISQVRRERNKKRNEGPEQGYYYVKYQGDIEEITFRSARKEKVEKLKYDLIISNNKIIETNV